MKDFLFTEEGRQFLLKEYVEKERSTYDIAKERGTYANRVRRALLHHRMVLRDKCSAQKAALKAGRHVHPTRGRRRTETERKNISSGLRETWAKQSSSPVPEGEQV